MSGLHELSAPGTSFAERWGAADLHLDLNHCPSHLHFGLQQTPPSMNQPPTLGPKSKLLRCANAQAALHLRPMI